MKTLTQYLTEQPKPEEWLPVMLAVSSKILDNASRGIQDRGKITVTIMDEKDPTNGIDISGSDRKIIENSSIDENKIEEIYRETVSDLSETYRMGYPSLIHYVDTLAWRFIDNNSLTDKLIMQVIEKYVEGTVPMDDDILHIGVNGLLPVGAFQDPISFGEDYYNKESARKTLPPWDVFISLNMGDKNQAKEKAKITMELASRYLSRFFTYYWKYRIAFRGSKVMEKRTYFALLIDSVSPIHPITFLFAKPVYLTNNKQSECESYWDVGSKIGAGTYGDVFKACCEEKCDYAIKLIRPGGNEIIPYLTIRELTMWNQAQKLDISPRLIEYYYHKSKNPTNDYFIIVMEAMDYTLTDMLRLADRENHSRLRTLFFKTAGDLLKKLHANGMVHADSHFGNFMLKCDDKSVYQSADKLYLALLGGTCRIRLIDYGFSTSLDRLKNQFEKELPTYFSVFPRLYSLGCISREQTELKSPTRGEWLFEVLCFYDFALLMPNIKKTYDNAKELFTMVTVFENEVFGTRCLPGKMMTI
jgi:Protein kinase domain